MTETVKPLRILAINPGSTSTKIAIFDSLRTVFQKSIKHSAEELAGFSIITDQFAYRKELIVKELLAAGIDIQEIGVVVGRGGMLKPIQSGVYEVNEAMIRDLKIGIMGQHASNLGGIIAQDLVKSIPGAKAYIADPVVVDELSDVARIAGHPNFSRQSIFHALNQKAVARSFARSIDKPYEELNLIVAHLGGGISVGVHEKGRVVDVNQGLDGEGPFSPERSGTLPVSQLIRLCYSSKYTQEEVHRMVLGQGGLVAYLGTNEASEVERRVKEGDQYALLIYEAMAYQVSKEIGACSVVLKGRVDAILLTGGVAFNERFVQMVTFRIAWIAPVRVFPGEDEMRALALNGLLVSNGEIEPKVYI